MAETTRTTSESISPGARSGDLAARAIDDIKGMGSELLAAARDSTVVLLDEQRSRAATEITALGNVLHSSVKALDEAGGPTVARYAEDAARQVDGFADKLRDSSWDELLVEAKDFARRYPLVFMAAAVGTGALAGRILFAPPPRSGPPPAAEPVGAGEALPGWRQTGAALGEVGGAPADYDPSGTGDGI